MVRNAPSFIVLVSQGNNAFELAKNIDILQGPSLPHSNTTAEGSCLLCTVISLMTVALTKMHKHAGRKVYEVLLVLK